MFIGKHTTIDELTVQHSPSRALLRKLNSVSCVPFLLLFFWKQFLLKHDLKDCKCFGSCVSWGNFSLLHVGGPSHPHGRGNPEGGNFNCGRMVSKNCMFSVVFAGFLSLNRITVAECVLNTVNLHLLCLS